jgi:hypothetical protein
MEYGRDEINRAFWDLGLRFQWDDPTWRNLVGYSTLCEKLRKYLEGQQPHLLKIYDCESITKMVEERLASPVDARVGMEAHRSF